jgi:hypothetical protein
MPTVLKDNSDFVTCPLPGVATQCHCRAQPALMGLPSGRGDTLCMEILNGAPTST